LATKAKLLQLRMQRRKLKHTVCLFCFLDIGRSCVCSCGLASCKYKRRGITNCYVAATIGCKATKLQKSVAETFAIMEGAKKVKQVVNSKISRKEAVDSSRPTKIKLEREQDIKRCFSGDWTMMATSIFMQNHAAAGRRGPPSPPKQENSDNSDSHDYQQCSKACKTKKRQMSKLVKQESQRRARQRPLTIKKINGKRFHDSRHAARAKKSPDT
jgi:hypothetical protein